MRLENPEWLFAFIPLAILVAIMLRSRLIRIKDKHMSSEYEIIRARKRNIAGLMTITRILIIGLLLLALASPFIITQRTVPGNEAVTILVDNSRSFEIFDKSVANRLKRELEKSFPVQLKNIGNDISSALGDGLAANLRGNDNIILVTDGHANQGQDLGDVILYASSLNATIHALGVTPQSRDVSVRVLGPAKTVSGVENNFLVQIDNPSNIEVSLRVTVDGRQVISRSTRETEHSFTQLFNSGSHEIVAEVLVDDYFSANNIYYKSLEVVDKPNILFVNSKEAPVKKILNELYVVDESPTIPDDLSKYFTVVLNDIRELSDSKVDQLSDYVIDGNGLVVVGGQNSYDLGKYENSFFETLLPVKIGLGNEIEGDINIVLAIDISGSTGQSFGVRGGSY